jgi:hypothetical protein
MRVATQLYRTIEVLFELLGRHLNLVIVQRNLDSGKLEIL